MDEGDASWLRTSDQLSQVRCWCVIAGESSCTVGFETRRTERLMDKQVGAARGLLHLRTGGRVAADHHTSFTLFDDVADRRFNRCVINLDCFYGDAGPSPHGGPMSFMRRERMGVDKGPVDTIAVSTTNGDVIGEPIEEVFQ